MGHVGCKGLVVWCLRHQSEGKNCDCGMSQAQDQARHHCFLWQHPLGTNTLPTEQLTNWSGGLLLPQTGTIAGTGPVACPVCDCMWYCMVVRIHTHTVSWYYCDTIHYGKYLPFYYRDSNNITIAQA